MCGVRGLLLMTDFKISRRRALCLAGVMGTSALAGCSGVLSGNGESSGDRPIAWAPAPSEVTDHGEIRVVNIGYGESAGAPENAQELQSSIVSQFPRLLKGIEVPREAFSAFVTFENAFVVAGAFERDPLVSKLESGEFESAGNYDGYRLFRPKRSRPSWLVGIGESLVGTTPEFPAGDADHRRLLEITIDAKESGNNRWIDSDSVIRTIDERMGDGYSRFARRFSGSNLGINGTGVCVQDRGDTDQYRVCVVFESADARSRVALDQLESEIIVESIDEGNVSEDGNVLMIERSLRR